MRGIVACSLLAGILGVGSVLVGHRVIARDVPAPAEQIQREIDILRAGGEGANSQRLLMLEDVLEDWTAQSPATASAAEESSVERVRDAVDMEPRWDRGVTGCEAIPQRILTADEVEDAVCLSVPISAEGTSRYIAISPEGVVRVVRFADSETPRRLADQVISSEIASDARARYEVFGNGTVVIRANGGTATINVR